MVDSSGRFDESQWLQPLLELENRKLGPEVAGQLAEGLITTDIVRYLGLRCNNLGDTGVKALMQGMNANHGVEMLDLSDNNIKDEGAIAIANMLKTNSTLQALILSNNKIRKAGAEAIAEALKSNFKIKKLILSGNKIRDGGAIAIASTLEQNNTLQSLDMNRNEINQLGGKAIAAALQKNKSLQSLHIANNLLGASVVELGPALSLNSTLVELNLEDNGITSEIASKFGNGLLKASLMTLNVSNNKIGDRGMRPILDCFKFHSQLRYLDLSNTNITAQSMEDVVSLLRMCPNIETLQVDGNAIGSEGVTLLASTIKEYHSLTSLNIDRCGLDTPSIIALSIALSHNPLFTSLTISGNNMSDEAFRSLSYSLKRMTMLVVLDLSNNAITDSVMDDLSSIFVNNILTFLSLQGNPISSKLANGVLTRRNATNHLSTLPESSTVITNPTPIPTNLKRMPLSLVGTAASGSPSLWLQTTNSSKSSLSNPFKTTRAVMSPAAPSPMRSSVLSFGDTRNTTLLSSEEAQEMEEGARTLTSYPPLIVPKTSLEHPLYPGFGRGRFSNPVSIHCADHLPYTIANSIGSIPVRPWNNNMSTSEALFAAPIRRPRKIPPYSERHLEANVGALLVTERQLRQAFAELDVDGNGWLDRVEFEELYRTFEGFGVNVSEDKVREVLMVYKPFDDGKLTFDEFSLLMLKVAQR
eukprot:NODE_950_length_2226_cov_40.526866_g812_i0.p1 GENE.NODE_950_length_2226_cov_40.526866_g812_i0~~NODE_950_length_2226_cov_40.526866_g812_i0.p1  ORF type:complete len:699 (+),score=144.91 NODE_950_length_2226_cov_40.526866_g812_i0:83-2179(+)